MDQSAFIKIARQALSLYFFFLHSEVPNDKYEGFPSKRLVKNVIKTVMTSSRMGCTRQCSLTDGCLAVNVIGNHDIICELTTGLSNETEMADDQHSQLFVLS